jgi:hypothetical protein
MFGFNCLQRVISKQIYWFLGKYRRIIKPFTNEYYPLKTDYITFIYLVLKSINYKLNQDLAFVVANIFKSYLKIKFIKF